MFLGSRNGPKKPYRPFRSFSTWSQSPKLAKAIMDFRRDNWETIPRAPRIQRVRFESKTSIKG